ncbi:WG repeat-containing protein [Paenibacillus sedimenti]|uniref:WG repeat-containing protein n=1 Tax=Paenibacillus sedimenti TaxID=2770274 RepID=A0A926QMZ9_9BACL|nr:WG repeat-containing protein [Paenibacillus sedimenti]MBD0384237.1 WG repeat-containing protein [Paenibacillus sedimenti]
MMVRKKRVALHLILSLMACLTGTIPIEASNNALTIRVDGEPVTFAQKPFIEDGTTLVPFRPLFEKMGWQVDWDPQTRKVIAAGDGLKVEMTPGVNAVDVNGEDAVLDKAPAIVNGTVFVPLRFVGEASGRKVTWIERLHTVTIGEPKLYPIQHHGKYGLVDHHGQRVMDVPYSSVLPFSEGLAQVWNAAEDGNGSGYIDDKGQLVIPRQYYETAPFSEGLAYVTVLIKQDVKKHQYIDTTGKVVMEPDILFGSQFHEGLAAVAVAAHNDNGYTYGYLNVKGEFAISPHFDFGYDFSEGLGRVKNGDKFGFIDITGTLVIETKFDDAWDFHNGLAPVKIGEKWGYIDKQGNWSIPLQYENAQAFSEGLAAIRTGNKWGYIDSKGKLVIQPAFENTKPFASGLAAVQIGDWEWGYINKRGEVKIKPTYYLAEPFAAGIANVRVGWEGEGPDSGYIDINGNYIWTPSR